MTTGSSRDLARQPEGDRPALVEHLDPVAELHDQPQVVVDDDDRAAELGADPADVLEQLVGLGLVHAGRRLVEQDQRRAAHDGARDLEPPLHAVGQVHRLLALDGTEAEPREHLVDRGPRSYRGGARGLDVLPHGELGEQPDVLERAGQPEARDPVRLARPPISGVVEDDAPAVGA